MKKLLLYAIIVVAILLRFVGTNPGYNRYHTDEPIIYGTAIDMVEKNTLDPGRFDYPGGAIYINYIFFKFLFIPVMWVNYYLSHIPQIIDGVLHIPISALETQRLFTVYILGGRDFYPLFWGRYVVALFSVGNVFLIYLLSKKLFNERVGMISAILLTFNFRQVLNSHIDIPDIYNAFFLLLSFITAVNVWQKPNTKNYLIAGIVGGLSVAMKYQIYGLIPIALCHLYRSIKSRKINFKELLDINIIIASLATIATFIVLNPYFFLHFETAKIWIQSVSSRYGIGANSLNLFPISYFYHYDYGPLGFFAVILGLFVAVKKFPQKSILLLSSIIPFLITFLYISRGGFHIRNFVTITPILLIFSAIFIYWLLEKLPSFFYIPVILAIIYLPARNSIINTYYYTQKGGYNVLTEWLYENFLVDSVIAAHPFDPPTGSPPMKKTEFEIGGAYSMAEHIENGASYSLLNTDWAQNPFFFWMGYGLKDLKLYWNKPVDILRNTFYGLAAEELFRYQIFVASKAWQAPDETLVLSKFPNWPKEKMSKLLKFDFNDGAQGWGSKGNIGNSSKYVFDAEAGKDGAGSLKFLPGNAIFSIKRFVSPVIVVKGGHLYKVSADLKSEIKLDPHKRDGFFRIDFYDNDKDLEKVGIISSVSSRIYGASWIKKEITERAPLNSKFMTISFQVDNPAVTGFWMDNVEIQESIEATPDITQEKPYTKTPIDLNLLYTNSGGNL